MATNPWVSRQVRGEQNLYEDLVIESLQFYGQDVYYLPRELVNVDKVFLDDVPSHFSDAYKIEMYVENVDGFGGEGDLFSKFGVELRDQATFVCARKRWKNLIGDKLDSYNFRPREGDVIYIPFSGSLFEIFKVETETPFYQLNNLPTFRLQCELFEYNDEDFDTDVPGIDQIEIDGAYQYKLQMQLPEASTALASTLINDEGQVTQFVVENSGAGYTPSQVPNVVVAEAGGNNSKFGNSSLDVSRNRSVSTNYAQTGANGTVEMWVYVENLPSSGQTALFKTGGNGSDAQTFVWGVNQIGQLVYGRGNNSGAPVISLTDGDILFQPRTWHHILIGNFNENEIQIYFDDTKYLDTVLGGTTWNTFTSTGLVIGKGASGVLDGHTWQQLDGLIDEARVLIGDKATVLAPRYANGIHSTLQSQDAEWTPSINDGCILHMNTINALGTSLVGNDGRVEGMILNQQGLYYNTAPTVTIDAPYSGGNYKRNETITQAGDGYTITGEVAQWSDSDKILYLVHVGADDGKYHTFNTTNAIVGAESNAAFAASVITENNQIQEVAVDNGIPIAQNDYFDDFEGDFLDFSESNPFGDAF
jgi:hypothetical protein